MRTDFQYTTDPPRARLRIAGELDLSTGEQLEDLLHLLEFRRCSSVEVDLSAVTFVDAYTLAMLHREQQRLRTHGGDLEVVAGSACYLLVSRVAGYETLQPVSDVAPHLTVLRTRRHLVATRTAGG